MFAANCLVSVLGLGTVGLPTATHISNFFKVKGYDIKKEAVERARSIGIEATDSWNEVSNVDVYVITVNTGIIEAGKPDVSSIYDVFSKLSSSSSLVCVESTVPVHTSRKLSEKFGLKYVVHCPHRYWPGDPVNHGVVQPRVLGAISEESLKIGKEFYDLLKIPVHPVSSIEVAEISKIAENAYRFVQIASVEELSLICGKLGLPFEEVREACNTKWNIELLEARDGIGGYCLPKDILMLTRLNLPSSPSIFHEAIRLDKIYKKRG